MLQGARKRVLRWLGLGLALGLLLGLAACAAKGSHQLALGMSKDQVIEIMGAPAFTSAESALPGEERLTWYVKRGWGPWSQEEEFFARLKKGRLEAYGRRP